MLTNMEVHRGLWTVKPLTEQPRLGTEIVNNIENKHKKNSTKIGMLDTKRLFIILL